MVFIAGFSFYIYQFNAVYATIISVNLPIITVKEAVYEYNRKNIII